MKNDVSKYDIFVCVWGGGVRPLHSCAHIAMETFVSTLGTGNA